MTDLADQLIGEVRTKRSVDLSKVTMTLAVNVAARVVGLTDSRVPGMDKRLDAFFAEGTGEFRATPRGIFEFLRGQANVLALSLSRRQAGHCRTQAPAARRCDQPPGRAWGATTARS